MQQIAPRKTIVEARFDPQLSFYGSMDAIAASLLSKIGGNSWERTSQAIQIFDISKRACVFLGHDRYSCELDGPAADQSIAHAFTLLKMALEMHGSKSIRRIGIRQWFAIQLPGHDEKRLIQKLQQAYLTVTPLAEAVKMNVEDIALVLEFVHQTNPLQSSRLQLGAMDRKQWVNHTPYSLSAGKKISAHLGSNGVQKIVDELPQDFIFIDVDKRISSHGSEPPLSLHACETFAGAVESDQKKMAQAIIASLKAL
jgi:hypothetical protein